MGILDKAKSQLQERLKGLGEETVRVMDAVKEEPESKSKSQKAKKTPVVRAEKPKKALIKPPTRNKIVKKLEKDEETVFETQPEVAVEEEPSDFRDESSAFELEDEEGTKSFMKNMTLKHKKKMKEYESVPVPVPDEGKIQDVLEILNIPATFEIDNDIFLPEDLEEVGFDIQVPQGYEMGEVDTFVSRVEVTIKKFVELLSLRNEHVAKLATVVDRLQVDVSNIKFQSEIANGINIMPTNDDDDYEQENLELKLIIKRLEEELEKKNGVDDTLTSEERETYDKLQDELSLKNRDIKDLEDEIYELKNKLAMQDEDEETNIAHSNEDTSEESAFEFDEESEQYLSSKGMYVDSSQPHSESENLNTDYYEEISNYNNPGSESALPSFDSEDFYENTDSISSREPLPEMYDFNDNDNSKNDSLDFVFEEEQLPDISFDNVDNSNYRDFIDFQEENESLNDNQNFNSSIEILDDNGSIQEAGQIGTYYDPDEEEDEIERLQNWSNNQ